MLIRIELRDIDPHGKRMGGKVVMSSCRVVKQAGDGLRMDNLAPGIQRFYHCMTAALLQKDPENPEVDKVDKGRIVTIQNNLARFLAPSDKEAK